MKKRVTIKDIAEALQTNSSTVSRALNNHPAISDAMKKKVIRKAREMGYAPNHTARQLRSGQSKTIGLVVPQINRIFFANFIHGMEAFAKTKGYQVLICQTNNSAEEEKDSIQMLINQPVAGIVISISDFPKSKQAITEGLESKIPLVMFDRAIPSLDCPIVVNANREGGYQATSHLIQQGYKRILYFGGSQELNIYQERFGGYCQALAEAGIAIEEELVFHTFLTREEGKKGMQEILASGLEFDSLFSASDYSGLGAMLELQHQGIAIPLEKGVVGFANEPFTELIGMSSVEQHSVEMGNAAAKLIIEQIEEDSPVLAKKVVIPAKLIARASSLKHP